MPVKVFVVDDSAVVRQTVMHILQGDPDIELAGSAPNPLIAAPLIRKSHPDVLLLDIEMPGMDGLTVFRQQMIESPIPTVICSTLTSSGSKVALDALAAGAVAVVGKPQLGLRQFLEDSRAELLQALKSAARTRPRAPSLTCASAIRPAVSSHCRSATSVVHAFAMNKPVVLGSSTGGTQAIESVLMRLPADSPGIAIVQHMPEKFTAMYAQRLDQICAMSVREARDGDRLERGVVLIAPGGRHMQLRKTGGQYFVSIADGPPVNRHKPSVEVLFRSAAECAGKDARTIAQDEQTCVVFGMPKESIRLGAVDDIVPIDRVAESILRFDARA